MEHEFEGKPQGLSTTLGMEKGACFSTGALFIWWVVVGSNHWPSPCEGDALPLS